jgi:hypothetical protein
LQGHDFDGLQDEITLLRVYIRRVLKHSAQAEDLASSILILQRLSTALFCLGRLVRIENMNGKNGRSEFMEEFNATLKLAQQDMGIK